MAELLLRPGDTVGYSVSQEVPSKRSTTWIKCEATTSVRNGETPSQAKARLTKFVNGFLEERIADILE